jgi:hypothetical protein
MTISKFLGFKIADLHAADLVEPLATNMYVRCSPTEKHDQTAFA